MRLKQPLDPKAVAQANKALWEANPELERRQLSMSPGDTRYREQWVKAYLAAGGQPEPSEPAKRVDDPVQPCPVKNPADETKVKDNTIDLVFDPDKSAKVTKCDKIVHVQFIKIFVDNKETKPGDLISGWAYRDSVIAPSGWWIDHLSTETTPDYQQGTGNGKKNGASQKATITDAPNIGDDTIIKPYDPVNNPTGWKEIKFIFETYAYCMAGPDCGKWYEGVKWEYKKSWEEHRDGKTGQSTIIDKCVTTPPSPDVIQAFDKFNKAKGYTPCT